MEATEITVLDSVKAAFPFSVDKYPLSGPDGMRTDLYGLFRSDNAEHVGKPCSKNYVPHQSDDVVALVEAAGEAFEGIGETMCTFKDAHHVCVSPGRDQRRAIYGTSDNIFPRFMIRGGYDGRGFLANMGFYRDACSNLSMMRQVEGTSVSIRHGSGLREKMDDLIQTFSVLKQSWATLGDVIAELQSRDVNMPEFLDQVYGQPEEDSQRSKKIHENRTKAIFRRMSRERFTTGRGSFSPEFGVSAWEAYNAIQGYVQHDASRKGSPSDFDRVIAASNDQYVRKAEKITMELLAA
jgi:hypothetical protein|tara:strand:+ start:150 stop:1034 length:885 start_codon:yes stop_codon:yes gene_type:complete